MLETMFNLDSNSALGLLGILAIANTIIVEVLKTILPKKIPTKLVSIISAIAVSIGYVFIFSTVSIKTITFAVFCGFVVAFVSMFGFDSFKEVVDRFKIKDGEGGEK